MRLLTGPPGSGKTHQVLEILRGSIRSGRNDAVLLTPTATMAEHLRNEMAREGLLVHPEAVQTLWGFLRPLTPEWQEIPEGTLRLLVRQVLKALDPPEFRKICGLPGFLSAIVALIGELDASGQPPDELRRLFLQNEIKAPYALPILSIASKVWQQAKNLGMVPRSVRFQRAAERIEAQGLAGFETVLLDGFFSLTRVELDLIQALERQANVVLTLPEWEGAAAPQGQAPERCERVRQLPHHEVFAAPTTEKEAEEIARQILLEAAEGRRLREMGVILRSRAQHVDALERAFGRFGIPARFYFGEPLSRHPMARLVNAVIEARLADWSHEKLLDIVRLLPATRKLDRLELRLMDKPTGNGLAGAGPLERLAGFGNGIARPPAEWAEEIASLTTRLPRPEISDEVTHEQAGIWQSHAAAEKLFKEAMEQAATAIGVTSELSLDEFWREVQIILAATPIRTPDRRRDVVHVMDVYEARQWELPVVFVCGLVERRFPRHHMENPLLGDEPRRRLAKLGIRLPTSKDRDAEEVFLFELATTRATEKLVLSHPLYDSRGEEYLRSFLLERFREEACLEVRNTHPVRPRPRRMRAPERLPVLQQPDLLRNLAEQHATLSPSSIESFLQCPFAFFAGKTLRLRQLPLPVDERLTPLVEGSAAHGVLAAIVQEPDMLKALAECFDPIFEKTCGEHGVPTGYRKETARLELRDSLERFVERHGIGRGHITRTEEEFTLQLDKRLAVRGRVDRADFHFGRGVLLVDYKYTRPYNLRAYIAGNEDGRMVQAGLYLLAVRDVFGQEPAGFLFCAVNRGPAWAGWHTLPELSEVVEQANSEVLGILGDTARTASLEVAERIRAGDIAADPADASKCMYCPHQDICRVETQIAIARAGGGG